MLVVGVARDVDRRRRAARRPRVLAAAHRRRRARRRGRRADDPVARAVLLLHPAARDRPGAGARGAVPLRAACRSCATRMRGSCRSRPSCARRRRAIGLSPLERLRHVELPARLADDPRRHQDERGGRSRQRDHRGVHRRGRLRRADQHGAVAERRARRSSKARSPRRASRCWSRARSRCIERAVVPKGLREAR